MPLTTAPLMSSQMGSGFGAPGGEPTGTPNPCQQAGVITLQSMLEGAGHDVGVIDGVYGGRTTRAMQAFQRANRLAVSAYPNAETLSALHITIMQDDIILSSRQSAQCLARSSSGGSNPGGTTGPRVDEINPAAGGEALAERMRSAVGNLEWYWWVGGAAVIVGGIAMAAGAAKKGKRRGR